jgi:hypothetical protein
MREKRRAERFQAPKAHSSWQRVKHNAFQLRAPQALATDRTRGYGNDAKRANRFLLTSADNVIRIRCCLGLGGKKFANVTQFIS